jgi:hypothetical protein
MAEFVVLLWQNAASLGGCWPKFRDTFVLSVRKNSTLLSIKYSQVEYKQLYSSFKYLRQKETPKVSWKFKLNVFMLLGTRHWVKIIQTYLDSQKSVHCALTFVLYKPNIFPFICLILGKKKPQLNNDAYMEAIERDTKQSARHKSHKQ